MSGECPPVNGDTLALLIMGLAAWSILQNSRRTSYKTNAIMIHFGLEHNAHLFRLGNKIRSQTKQYKSLWEMSRSASWPGAATQTSLPVWLGAGCTARATNLLPSHVPLIIFAWVTIDNTAADATGYPSKCHFNHHMLRPYSTITVELWTASIWREICHN